MQYQHQHQQSHSPMMQPSSHPYPQHPHPHQQHQHSHPHLQQHPQHPHPSQPGHYPDSYIPQPPQQNGYDHTYTQHTHTHTHPHSQPYPPYSSSSPPQHTHTMHPSQLHPQQHPPSQSHPHPPSNQSYLSSLSSYLPSSLTSLVPSQLLSTSTPQKRRMIQWQAFDSYKFHGCRHDLLLLGLSDGFQIYRIYGLDDIRKIVEHYETTPIGCIRVLHHPADTMVSDGTTTTTSSWPWGPLVAVTSAEDRPAFPRTVVKIYSILSSRYIHVLRFRSKVHGVMTSSSTLVIALEQEIHVYATPTGVAGTNQALQLELLFHTRCYPNPEDIGVLALGPRWLAYAGCESAQSMSTHSPSMSSISPPLSPALLPSSAAPVAAPPLSLSSSSHPSLSAALQQPAESLSSVAKGIATGLYTLGGIGKAKITHMLANGDDQEWRQPISAATLAAQQVQPYVGSIIVRDIRTQRVLSHFKAHDGAIIAMTFDPSGTLLVTVPADGQYVHLYQVISYPQTTSPATNTPAPALSASNSPAQATRQVGMNSNTTSSSPPSTITYTTRHLYRLFRGITHATIRWISFSHDSKWLTLSSTKGTTHVYAINPIGGSINATTHGTQHVATIPPLYTIQDGVARDLSPICRIKHGPATRFIDPPHPALTPLITTFINFPSPHSHPHPIHHLMSVTPDATLMIHRLESSFHSHTDKSDETRSLVSVQAIPLNQWDLSDVHCGEDRVRTQPSQDGISSSPSSSTTTTRTTTSVTPFFQNLERMTGGHEQEETQEEQQRRWLSQVELRTYASAEVPFWASPQFTLHGYGTAPPSAPSSSSSPFFTSYPQPPSPALLALTPSSTSYTSLLTDTIPHYPIVYDKFATFDGLRSASALNADEVDIDVDRTDVYDPRVENELSQAMAASMMLSHMSHTRNGSTSSASTWQRDGMALVDDASSKLMNGIGYVSSLIGINFTDQHFESPKEKDAATAATTTTTSATTEPIKPVTVKDKVKGVAAAAAGGDMSNATRSSSPSA